MPTSVSSSMARARAAFSSMFRWMVSGSMICSPILSTGLSEVMGSWKIMAISRPRMRRISSSESFSSSLPPSKRDLARGDARGARRQQAHHRQRRDRFAGAGLADNGHHLARMDRIAQPLDGPDRAVARSRTGRAGRRSRARAATCGRPPPSLPVQQTPYCRGSRRPRYSPFRTSLSRSRLVGCSGSLGPAFAIWYTTGTD